jgi:hypothetical protein
MVPAAYLWQFPAPSQTPFVPQLEAPWSAQAPRGFAVAGAGMHTPTLPVSAHEKHGCEQSVSQQTPSSQLPLAHSVAIEHACPMPACTMSAEPPSRDAPGG